MAEETEQVTLDDLLPIDWTGDPINEYLTMCPRCECVVFRAYGARFAHERWHAAIETEAISAMAVTVQGVQIEVTEEFLAHAILNAIPAVRINPEGRAVADDCVADAFKTDEDSCAKHREFINRVWQIATEAGHESGTSVTDFLRDRLAELAERRSAAIRIQKEQCRVALVNALEHPAEDTTFEQAVELVETLIYDRKQCRKHHADVSQGETNRLRRIEDALVKAGAPNRSERGDPGGLVVRWIERQVQRMAELQEENKAAGRAIEALADRVPQGVYTEAVKRVTELEKQLAEREVDATITRRHHALLLLAAKGRQEYADGAPDDQAQKLGFEADVFLTAANLVAQPNRIGLLIPYEMQTAEVLAEVGVDYPVGAVEGDGTVVVREPAPSSTVTTVDPDLAAKISQAIHDPGKFVDRDRTWDDTFDRWEYEGVAAWGARAVMSILAPEVGQPAEAEVCPSLYLHNDTLVSCKATWEHDRHQNTPTGSGDVVWFDDQAVLSPWPVDREPPAGINVLHDIVWNMYLCRETDGWVWWDDLEDRNDADGEAHEWATAVLQADGDLIVVRP
jgi:hypothetical protein